MVGYCCLVAKPVALQAPWPMGFPRQKYWCGLPFPAPGDLPNLGIKPKSLCLLHWQVDSLPLHLGSPMREVYFILHIII